MILRMRGFAEISGDSALAFGAFYKFNTFKPLLNHNSNLPLLFVAFTSNHTSFRRLLCGDGGRQSQGLVLIETTIKPR